MVEMDGSEGRGRMEEKNGKTRVGIESHEERNKDGRSSGDGSLEWWG